MVRTSTSFDTLISNGFIVDGTGAPGFYGDVGIRDGRIAEVGRLGGCEASRTIDATGKIVAPGHVTQHSHYDAALFWDPYCLDSGANGITTVVNANCGFGFAPVKAQDAERTMLMMSTTEQIPVTHQRAGMPWDWESFPDWMDRLHALPKGVNVSTYLPLNPLLIYVMGVDAAKTRSPDAREMKELHRLINEAMDAGAIGVSMSSMGAEGNTHVDYDGTSMPTDSMDHDAIVEICRAVVERGEGIIQVLSQIAIFGDRSITERLAELARGSGVRVIHNAFLTNDELDFLVPSDLVWLSEQRGMGRDITAGALLNRGWVEAGVRELDAAGGQFKAVRSIVACADDDEIRALLSDNTFLASWEAELAEVTAATGASGLAGQTVIDVGGNGELESHLGRTLNDIATETGQSVVAVLADLALRTGLALQLKSPPIGATGPEQAMSYLDHAGVIGGGSDGGAHTKAFGMGHYPTDLLIWLVREQGVRTLEDMHFQLGLKSARSVQIYDRGALLPGFWADVLVYDLNDLYFDMTRYDIVHDMPNGDWRRKGNAGGYEYILVNGEITHEGGTSNGQTPGQVVRVTSPA